MKLVHVAARTAWQAAIKAGHYAPAELARDGFLHCSTPEQLAFVLARHFAGARNVLVLTFESDDVPAPIRWVHSEPDQPPFPHLYGPIPCSAVLGAEPPPA